MADLPPCGIYRTALAIADQVPAGRFVYFHRHGDPGPGVYLPSGWSNNRARFHDRGHTIPSPEWAASLVPLRAEGLYRVREPFTCCARQCRSYPAELLVQLGYDGGARALLFVPQWTDAGLAIPELDVAVDDDRLGLLAPLVVEHAATAQAGDAMH